MNLYTGSCRKCPYYYVCNADDVNVTCFEVQLRNNKEYWDEKEKRQAENEERWSEHEREYGGNENE